MKQRPGPISEALSRALLIRENFDETQQQIVKQFFETKNGKWTRRDFIGELERTIGGLQDIPALRAATCAVVGNGNAILNRKWGEEIDGHDIVIRMNEFRLAAYHENTGRRTHIHLFNEPRARRVMEGEYSSMGNLTIFCGPCNEHHAIELYLQILRRRQFPGLFTLLPSFRKSINEDHPGEPSLGFISVCFARQLGLDISLYGFNLDGGRNRIFGKRKFNYHDADFEYACYRTWEGEGFSIHT